MRPHEIRYGVEGKINVVLQQVRWWKICLIFILVTQVGTKSRLEVKDSKSHGEDKSNGGEGAASHPDAFSSWGCYLAGARTGVG